MAGLVAGVLCLVWLLSGQARQAAAAPLPALAPILPPGEIATYPGGWEYRWGDSPREANGELTWARPSAAGGEWRPFALPGIPPGRGDHRFLWLRTRLSGPQVSDSVSRPALLLLVVDQLVEAYLDGKRVYAFGILDGEGPLVRRFAGYRPHFIPLEGQYLGKTLALRIYAEHVNIGVFGDPAIGGQLALTEALVRRGQGKFVAGTIMILIGLLAFALWLTQRQAQATLAYAGFAASCGTWVLCQAQSRIFFLNAPLLWVHLEMWSLYLIPPCLIGYLMTFLGPGPFALTLRLMQLFWLYFAGAVLAVVSGAVPLMATWLPWALLMMSASLYITGMTLLAALGGNVEARIYIAGLCIAVLTFLYDTLSSLGILPRHDITNSHIGMGIFVVSLGAISARRYLLLLREHRQTSHDLKEKVHELQQMSSELRSVNDELMRQIDHRSRRLLDALLARIDADDGDPTTALAPLTSGSLLSEVYRIVRPIGSGGFGTVYEVERLPDGQHLAAKVVSSDASRDALLRFGREAQLLSRLHHENLVSIYDVDVTTAGRLFIIMELVDGMTLRQLRQRYGDTRWALPILQQIAAGLSAIHERGIVHRDLKPANILISALGASQPARVKLVDFGISILAREGDASEPTPTPSAERDVMPDATSTGVLVGTLVYMAPELHVGSRLAKPSSDIFSFGVLAYELLTTKMPYKNPAVRAVLQGEELPVPAELRNCPELDPALTELLERCLWAAPDQRPTARELQAALTAGIAALPPA